MPKDIDVKMSISGDGSTVRGLNKVDNSLEKVEKQAKETSTATKGLWKEFALGAGAFAIAQKGLSSLITLFSDSLDQFKEQERVETQLNAVLKSTGMIAGLTADELKKMASGLQNLTTFGDEAIIGAENLLLTFKQIGGDIFPRALESILDVSIAMEQDLKTSTIQLGKALNDPIIGLTALQRVGITFTEEQKNLIKGFANTNEIAKAQVIILEELESQFGGSAKAAAQTFGGQLEQLGNIVSDLQESFGEAIAEAILPLLKELKDWIVNNEDDIVGFFQGIGGAIKEMILTIAETKRVFSDLFDSIARVAGAPVDMRNEMKAGAKSIKDFGKEIGVFAKGASILTPPVKKAAETFDILTTSSDRTNESLEDGAGVIEELGKKIKDVTTDFINLAHEQAKLNIAENVFGEDPLGFGKDLPVIGDDLGVINNEVLELGLGLKKVKDAGEENLNVFEKLLKEFNEMNLADKVSLIKDAFADLGLELKGLGADLLDVGVGIARIASGDLVGGAVQAGIGVIKGLGKLLFPEKSKTDEEILQDKADSLKQIYDWALLTTDQAKKLWQGTIDIGEAVGQNFQEMAKDADIATREMFDLWDSAKKEGIEVAEIQAFINRNLIAGVDALKLYTGKFQTEFADDFASMLQGQGNTLQDIVEMMGEQAPEALRKFVEENKRVLNDITGLDGILKSLGNTQNLTEENFKKIQQQGGNTFERLIKNGATEEESLRSILPLLKDQIEFSELYGFGLSGNTKKLIEQAREAGLSFDDQKSASDLMVEGIDRIGDSIDRLVDLFSNDLPQAIGKSIGAVDVLGESMGSLPAPPGEFDESAPGAGSRGGQSRNNNFNTPVTINNHTRIQGRDLDESRVIRIMERGIEKGAGKIRPVIRKAVATNG